MTTNLDPTVCGKNIRAYRKERRWSQAKFADKIGAARNSISHWERGCNYPDPVLLYNMSRVFGVSMEEIMTSEVYKRYE